MERALCFADMHAHFPSLRWVTSVGMQHRCIHSRWNAIALGKGQLMPMVPKVLSFTGVGQVCCLCKLSGSGHVVAPFDLQTMFSFSETLF